MFFYYFTILLFFFPAFLETSAPSLQGKIPFKKVFIFLVIFVLIIQMGFRWETGTDWDAYLNHFYSQDIFTPFVNDGYGFENGYNFFVSAIKLILPEYSFFLLIHAFIFFLLLKKSYVYFTPYSLVSLLLFYVSFLGIWGSSRQLFAVGLGLLSLIFLYEKKWWQYLLCVFIAFQFHTTSLLLLSFFFLRKKFSNKTIVIILVLCILIGFSSLPLQIFSAFGGFNETTSSKTAAYLKQASEVTFDISIIGFFKRIIIFAFFFIFKNKISDRHPKFNFIFNGYLLGLCFYFLFVQNLAVMISRGSLYFNILEPILLSYIFCIVKDRRVIFIFIFLLLIYSFIMVNQSIATYPDLFDPYKGLFFNTDFHRNMY